MRRLAVCRRHVHTFSTHLCILRRLFTLVLGTLVDLKYSVLSLLFNSDCLIHVYSEGLRGPTVSSRYKYTPHTYLDTIRCEPVLLPTQNILRDLCRNHATGLLNSESGTSEKLGGIKPSCLIPDSIRALSGPSSRRCRGPAGNSWGCCEDTRSACLRLRASKRVLTSEPAGNPAR